MREEQHRTPQAPKWASLHPTNGKRFGRIKSASPLVGEAGLAEAQAG
jgi:hypothetical protein